jgi:hypothetical protein
VAEALLGQDSSPAAQGSQAATEGGKKRRVHMTSIYTCQALDYTLIMPL